MSGNVERRMMLRGAIAVTAGRVVWGEPFKARARGQLPFRC